MNQQLLKAVSHHDLKAVQDLLAQGVDINIKNSFNENLLFMSARSGSLAIVNSLLTRDNEFNYLCDNKKWASPVLSFLLQNGLSINTLDLNGNTLLHYAVITPAHEYDDVQHIQLLLDIGYPIDLLNKYEETPLILAIKNEMFFQAIYLIHQGAKLHLKDSNGKTALDYAENFSFPDCDFSHEDNLEHRAKLIAIIEDYNV